MADDVRVFLIPPDDFCRAHVIMAIGVYKDDVIKHIHEQGWELGNPNLQKELDDPNNAGFCGMTRPGWWIIYTRRFPKRC